MRINSKLPFVITWRCLLQYQHHPAAKVPILQKSLHSPGTTLQYELACANIIQVYTETATGIGYPFTIYLGVCLLDFGIMSIQICIIIDMIQYILYINTMPRVCTYFSSIQHRQHQSHNKIKFPQHVILIPKNYPFGLQNYKKYQKNMFYSIKNRVFNTKSNKMSKKRVSG